METLAARNPTLVNQYYDTILKVKLSPIGPNWTQNLTAGIRSAAGRKGKTI